MIRGQKFNVDSKAECDQLDSTRNQKQKKYKKRNYNKQTPVP